MSARVRPHERRRFLAVAAATAASVALPRRGSLAAESAPGNRIRVGAIGVGNRARLLLDQLPEGAEIVALSDCNLPRAEEYKAKRAAKWPVYQDYRRVLDHKDIDAVIVGTGEFQRVLPCIEACMAGKDVYAEKPLTLYVQEGRALVSAVRKYGRVLQVGSQQRSMAINRLACEFVRNGGLGALLEVRAINYKNAAASPSPPPPAEAVPAGLDWSQWLNQAADRPFNTAWMGWMKWRDFAGGEMTNWGAHGVDQIPRRAELFSESRAPAAILCPAALRAGAALRDPRRSRPHRPRPLRAPSTQGSQLGWPGARAEVHTPGC